MARSSTGSNIAFLALGIAYVAAEVVYMSTVADSYGIASGTYDSDDLNAFHWRAVSLSFGGTILFTLLVGFFKHIERPIREGLLVFVVGMIFLAVIYSVYRPLWGMVSDFYGIGSGAVQ